MLRRKSRDSLTYFASKLSGLPVIKDTIGKLDSLSRGHSISFLRCYRVLTQKQHFHRASGLSLTPEEFENILKVLSTKIAFISMGEALELIKNKERLSESYAVLTFDEGYIETLKNTNAILKKLNIPACMFTTTQHFAKKTYKNHLWNDLVSEYVAQKSPSIIKLPWMDKTLHTDTPAKLAESNRRIIRHLVWCDDARRKFLIADFLNQDIPSKFQQPTFLHKKYREPP